MPEFENTTTTTTYSRSICHDEVPQYIEGINQACFLAIKQKTQGEKTQNSRKKLKTQEQNSNFRHLRVEKLK